MKTVHGKPQRTLNRGDTLEGGLAFRLQADWAKLPHHIQGIHISGGSCDEDGNLIVGTRNTEYPIIMFDSSGKVVRTFGKGLFSYTHNVRVTPWNTLLCADSSKAAHVVREITMEGELIREFGEFGKPSETGYNPDEFIQAQREGRIPTGEPRDDKKEFHMTLDTIRFRGGPCNRPTDACAGKGGSIYISDGYGNCAVHKFDKEGKLLGSWGGPGSLPGQFRCPHAVWVDNKERVFVCDRENSRAQVFTNEGELSAVIDNLMTTGSVWSDDDYIYIGEFGGITILNQELDIVAQFGFEGMALRCHGLCGNSNSELFVMSKGNLYKLVNMC